MIEPEVTLRDVWQLLCSMDEGLDRIEGQFDATDARIVAFDAAVSAMGLGIEAKLCALIGDE